MPLRARVRLLTVQLQAGVRIPTWQPRGLRRDSRAARALGGVVTLLWRAMYQVAGSLEGIVARRRAGKTVAAADRLLSAMP
jgi:hypothetical protein